MSRPQKQLSKKENKANPFERKVTRPKHQILGKRLKGTEQNAGQLRHLATELVCGNSSIVLLFIFIFFFNPEKEDTTARI